MSLPDAASQSLAVLSAARRQDPSTVRTERRGDNLILMVKRGDGQRQRVFTMDNQFLEESF